MPSKSKSAVDLVEALQRKESPYESSSSSFSETSYGKPPPLYPELQEVPSNGDGSNLTSSSIVGKISKGFLTVALCGSLFYTGYYFYQNYRQTILKQSKDRLSKIDKNLTKVENNFSKLESKLNDVEKKLTALIRRKYNERFTEDYIQNKDENFDNNQGKLSSSAKDANGKVSSYYHFDSQGRKFDNKWDTFDADSECDKIDLPKNGSFATPASNDLMQEKADLRNQIAYIKNVTEKQQSFLDGIHFASLVQNNTNKQISSTAEGILVKEPDQEELIAVQIENLKFRRKKCATRSNNLLDRIDRIVKSFEEL